MGEGSVVFKARSALGTYEGAVGRSVVYVPGLHVTEEPLLPVYSLRVSRKLGAVAAQAFATACGVPLPRQPNTCAGTAEFASAWVEPLAWLLLGRKVPIAVAEVAPPPGIYLTELGARFCSLQLSGVRAPRLLAAAMSLDLADGSFAAGSCARTRLAALGGAFLQRLTGDTDYRLLVDVGLGPIVAEWLADAAALLIPGTIKHRDAVFPDGGSLP